ncbi:MAG: hypothetical protein ACK5PP_01970 [Acidimicrobiales bacterium]
MTSAGRAVAPPGRRRVGLHGRRHRAWPGRVGSVVVAALLVAGCGSGDDAAGDASSDPTVADTAADGTAGETGADASTDPGTDDADPDDADADDGGTGDELLDAVTATAAASSSTVTVTVTDGDDTGTAIAIETYGEDREVGIGPASSGDYAADEGPDDELVRVDGEWYYRSVDAGDDRWFSGATPVDDERLSLPDGFDPASSPVAELPALVDAIDPIEPVGPGRYLGDVDGTTVAEPGSLVGLATATGCTQLSALIELSGEDVTRLTLSCRADDVDPDTARSVVALFSALGTTEEITAPAAP